MKKILSTFFILVFICVSSPPVQARDYYRMAASNIDDIVGETFPTGSIHKIPADLIADDPDDELITGDTVIVFLNNDPTYGTIVFHYAYTSTSEATHAPPGVINMHGNTDPGRFILMRAGETPCDPADSDCYLDFPLNDNDAAAPAAGMLRLSAKDDNKLYMRLNGGNATEIATTGSNITGSAASLSVSGQTGLLTFDGIASTNRAKTVRDAADTVLELGGSYTPTGTWTWTSATATWPTFNQNTSGTAAGLSSTLAVASGGTGQTTEQAAIDSLTGVSEATNEHVLTKDTATGNAIFKAAAGGGGTWGSITGTLSDQTDLKNAMDAKAPLASPALSGNPTAPTQTQGNNSTRLATTAYVDGAVVAGASGYVATPAYSNEICTEGQWSFDASYIYLCEDTDTWDRFPVTFASWDSPIPYRYLENGTTTRLLENGTIRRFE